jgi:hypothetical protein
MPDNNTYQLVCFPEVQEYMEYTWFRNECYLLQAFEDQQHIDSAYFIPQSRIDEVVNNPKKIILLKKQIL